MAAHDQVNHPAHYLRHPSGVECIEVVQHMNFCRGNVVKYVWRAGLKDSETELQDLQKAAWYLAREIERVRAAGGGKEWTPVECRQPTPEELSEIAPDDDYESWRTGRDTELQDLSGDPIL